MARKVPNRPESASAKDAAPRKKSGASAPSSDVGRFLATARAHRPPAGNAGQPVRILFALDATASREPTWDLASSLHAELFQAAAGAGVAVQLAYYRGFREFYASPWTTSAPALLTQMTGVRCRGGMTQIDRVLKHALAESRRQRVKALVFVGDACEEEHDAVAATAGQLAVFKVPCFLFQEGVDAQASRVFRDIASISGGAHVPFQAGSAEQLRALFGAVASYAANGRAGIGEIGHDIVRGLLAQLP